MKKAGVPAAIIGETVPGTGLIELDAPVDVMVDGEVLTLQCEELDVLPGALSVVA
jgi:hypothetical protein